MCKRTYFGIATGISALLLTACGGGGGGSLASIPPPPPPPTFSYGSFPLTKSASFETVTADRTTELDASSRPFVSSDAVTALGPSVTFSYDQNTGSYSISDSTNSASFTAANASADGNFQEFAASSTNASDQLSLFNNVSSSAPTGIQLSYLSFGSWLHSDSGTGASKLTYFLFGFPTATDDMPRSGTATYNTIVAANEYLVGYEYQSGPTPLTGSASFGADFGTGQIDTALTLNRADNSELVGTFTGKGAISGSQFNGTFTATDPYFQSGSFYGSFFGPSAQEMGYAFDIRQHNPNPDPYGGASLPSLLDAWIQGAVVGTKK